MILVKTIGHIGHWNSVTVPVGVIALAALFAMSKFVPKLPAAIIVVILGIFAENLFDLHTKHCVKIVGTVPNCDAISETDTTASDALRKVHSTLARAHIRLLLARANAGVVDYLKRDGVLRDLGPDAVFPTVREAVDATSQKSPA